MPAPSRKPCPFCAEEILADAKKCKHCGEFLDGSRMRNHGGVKVSLADGFGVTVRCPECGYEGKAAKHVDGSFAVELVLWLFFLLPGLVYSVWRLSTKCYVCPKCSCREISKVPQPGEDALALDPTVAWARKLEAELERGLYPETRSDGRRR